MDDISSFSGFTQLGTPDSNNVSGTTPVSGTGSSTPTQSASSISKSELEAMALFMAAGIPILQAPGINGNLGIDTTKLAAALELSTAAKEHDIISKMWDSFIENIREIAERRKKDEIREDTVDANKPGPKSSTEYFTYLMSISMQSRANELGDNGVSAQFTNTFNHWMVAPVEAGSKTGIVGAAGGDYPSSSFIAGSVASHPDLLRTAVGFDSAALGIYLSSGPVTDAIYAVGPTSGLPGDYQAAAAMVAALLNGGAVAKATANTVAAAGAGKTQPDLQFAVNYAQQVMAIVTKNLGAEDPTDPYRSSQNDLVRLMLSSMALNMVYRAAYGGMGGKEFENLLAGNTKDLPDPIKGIIGQLVDMVNYYLNKNPGTKPETIARLMEYVDSKDSVDAMLETSNLFTSFLKADDVDANRLASGKG